MNKKILIGGLLVITAVAIIFVYFSFLSAECKNTETGWECVFRNELTFTLYRQKCEVQNGRWRSYGMAPPTHHTWYCDFSFKDAGKECTSSTQCKGKCVVDSEYIENNYPDRERYKDINCPGPCKGRCAEYPLRTCDWWFEVNNGTIEDHTGILCD